MSSFLFLSVLSLNLFAQSHVNVQTFVHHMMIGSSTESCESALKDVNESIDLFSDYLKSKFSDYDEEFCISERNHGCMLTNDTYIWRKTLQFELDTDLSRIVDSQKRSSEFVYWLFNWGTSDSYKKPEHSIDPLFYRRE